MDWLSYRKSTLIIAVSLVVLFAGVLSRCFFKSGYSVAEAQLVRVEKGDLDIQVQTVGVLDAARTHMVSSAIRGDKGKIIFLVKDGAQVAKDDVLVRLDPTPFETEVHRLGGEVRSLAASVDSANQMLYW
jgi:HlyD family secretion protein